MCVWVCIWGWRARHLSGHRWPTIQRPTVSQNGLGFRFGFGFGMDLISALDLELGVDLYLALDFGFGSGLSVCTGSWTWTMIGIWVAIGSGFGIGFCLRSWDPNHKRFVLSGLRLPIVGQMGFGFGFVFRSNVASEQWFWIKIWFWHLIRFGFCVALWFVSVTNWLTIGTPIFVQVADNRPPYCRPIAGRIWIAVWAFQTS